MPQDKPQAAAKDIQDVEKDVRNLHFSFAA